jgi:LemA protein
MFFNLRLQILDVVNVMSDVALMGGLLGVVVVVIVVYIYFYNRLQRFRNAADAELSQIKVAMKKRLDMIDQLLGAVQGYTKFEREVMEKVAALRAGVLGAKPEELAKIESESRSLLGTIRAVAEAYPDLKASTTVMKLMEAIVSVEDEIARQRYTYNNVVQELNTMIDTIPSNIIAGMSGIRKQEYLRWGDEIETAPKLGGIGPK